ncbi:MAG TPA: methionine adenosyltransferase, partial [Myxococcota bacterium]|nr:methionine adenosyltransferase [Myxococcota bacterium]
DLKRPIYERTAYHGHFGRSEFSWEQTSKVKALQEAVAVKAAR